MTTIDEIQGLTREHEQWRRECINLIPSENVTSPAVNSLLSSDFGHRYTARDKFYMGTRFTDELEQIGARLAKDVFQSQMADLRPLSGHVADLIVLACFTRPKDTLLCLSAAEGGYPGIWKQGLPDLLNLKVVGFPFSKEKRNIDSDEAAELILKVKPKVIVCGASLFLFPHPVRELSKVAHEVGATVGFDGSHVLGLIAGGQFQDPLGEGASVLFGSTHKSFFGPQGGIILADKKHGEVIQKRIYPGLVDNAHWNRIAGLTLALAEMREFGKAYAKQVVRNSQALGKALFESDFPVVCPNLGFTKSHQIIIDYGGYKKGRVIAKKLEKANMIADCAVRLGSCELTRRGMKEKEMLKIAEFIRRVIKNGEKPQKVKLEVTRFMAEFQKTKYCFE
jgi:glycine hydroxymethyltransferase